MAGRRKVASSGHCVTLHSRSPGEAHSVCWARTDRASRRPSRSSRGSYWPTSGSVVVNGRVSALLELGAGFHGELTGRENVRLNGAILGLTGRQITRAMDRIIEFAGIGEFIDAPVKIYSSGMFVRLGFAIAVSLDPEILMVDEVIAVGDEEFQRKCFDHLFELRKRGVTIVLVTHSLGLIRDMCDEAAWLEHGRVRLVGAARKVADGYIDDVNERELHASPADTPGQARPTTQVISAPARFESRPSSSSMAMGFRAPSC